MHVSYVFTQGALTAITMVGGGAGEKVVAMEKAGEKWPRVGPLSTAGLNPMSRR